ncbi:MAG: tRNA lysidine(34) synthetase TilS [Ruminococcaceae bacterium]|nr:tRNA lysidine(34) synthetase TilS [Oscillospiraceae bacterium]
MKFKMNFNYSEKVKNDFIKVMKTLSLPKEKFGILVGYSGGADSAALLSLLYDNRERFNFELYALHVNHMIRGDEADRDQEFCRKACEKLSVWFDVFSADVPALAKNQKTGLEETARNIRYKAFNDISQNLSKDTGLKFYIATAHNADDNTETILFNLTRGSSLSGICGIKAKRQNIIRPIINSSKEEICGYCEENGIKYITDSTNFDKKYTRNKLRHNVLPVLREINPSLNSAVSRLCLSLSRDNDYLNQVADEFISKNSDSKKLPLESFNRLHDSIKTRVLSIMLYKAGCGEFFEVHISSLLELCYWGKPHSRLDMPNGVTAIIESGNLLFKNNYTESKVCDFNISFEYGVNKIAATGDVIARFDVNDTENIEIFKNIYKKFIQTKITSATIKGALSLRSRRPGDRYNINGVNRKLKKLLWEFESDLTSRNSAVLVCDEDGILWIPGLRSRTGTHPANGENYQIFFFVNSKDI